MKRCPLEGAAFGHAKIAGKSLLVRGLNPLILVIGIPLAAPVLGPVRLRGDGTSSSTCPPAPTASRHGSTCGQQPGGRRRSRPDQPGTVHPRAARHTAPSAFNRRIQAQRCALM
jgi:hypothetical protein